MTTFTARSAADLLALVPIVIGFHPEDSAVLLTFGPADRKGRAVSCSDSFQARIDLPVVEHEQRAVATMLREVAAKHRVQVAALLIYTSDAEVAASFADLLVPDLLQDGVEVIDVIRADGDRFYLVAEAEDPGTAYDLGSHPLTAAAVLEGRVVLQTRDALRDTLVGTDPAAVAEVAQAADTFIDALLRSGIGSETEPEVLAGHGHWVRATIAEHLGEPDSLSAADAGALVVLLAVDPLREVAWSDLDRQNAAGYVDFLRALVRRTPAELSSGVSGLLGLAAWLAGDGALAWCSIDRCLAADPDDRLAHHVAALLESATPPTVWAPMAAGALPIFATDRAAVPGRPGSPERSPLGSRDGARRRRTGVHPG